VNPCVAPETCNFGHFRVAPCPLLDTQFFRIVGNRLGHNRLAHNRLVHSRLVPHRLVHNRVDFKSFYEPGGRYSNRF